MLNLFRHRLKNQQLDYLKEDCHLHLLVREVQFLLNKLEQQVLVQVQQVPQQQKLKLQPQEQQQILKLDHLQLLQELLKAQQ